MTPIRTRDRETLKRQITIIRDPAGFVFACPECRLTRRYVTESGCVTRAAEHLLQRHRIRLTLPARKVPAWSDAQKAAAGFLLLFALSFGVLAALAIRFVRFW